VGGRVGVGVEGPGPAGGVVVVVVVVVVVGAVGVEVEGAVAVQLVSQGRGGCRVGVGRLGVGWVEGVAVVGGVGVSSLEANGRWVRGTKY
jgi:hypothetical protein